MKKNPKLTDEIVINLWNEKRTVKGKKMTIERKNHFLGHGLQTVEELINHIKERQYDANVILLDAFISIFREEYEDETGKHSIWRGKVTKQFMRWLKEYE